MKNVFRFQIVFVLLGYVAYAVQSGGDSGLAFASGAAVVLIALIFNALSFHGVFKKKSIAISLPVIVLKYPILVGLVYFFLKVQGQPVIWFSLGLATILFSVFGCLMGKQNTVESAAA